MPKERKASVWSRARIDKLIELYQKHECLWNPFDDYYKNKGKRNRAIEAICKELNVSKPEYAKKIHNLRNQFNSELKKYERLMEENEEATTSNEEYQCRWCHYKKLMFLKSVIEPRPGSSAHPSKRTRSETNNSSSVLTSSDDIYIEGTLDNGDVDGFDDFGGQDNLQKLEDETHEIITVTKSDTSPSLHSGVTSLKLKNATPHDEMQATSSSQSIATGTLIELSASGTGRNISAENQTILENKFEIHDQWSAFGKFIANEFRNYHSESSRRKLKRKIMQAMLEVGEEDDALASAKYI